MQNPVARSMKYLWTAALGITFLGLAGCSSDGEDAIEPNPLPEFKEEVTLKEAWSHGVGDGQGEVWLHLTPAVDGGQIFVTGVSGRVTSLDRISGKKSWSVDLKRRISGGTGVGGGIIALGTRDGHVIALDETSGKVIWETAVSSEALAAPQIDQGVVVVQTADAKLTGLDVASGNRIWLQEVIQPVLTLRGTATPTIRNGVVYAGFANGEARAFRLNNGSLMWSHKIAVPRGSSELERMVDIDASPLFSSDLLYMIGYQGNVVALDPAGGRPLWSREASSFESMSEGFGNLYLSDATSVVSAVDQRTGAIVWSQKELLHRNLSGPATLSSYVFVGDFEGYIHGVSQVDGRIVSRSRLNSSGIRVSPIVVGNMMYVYANDGELAAYTIK